MSMLEALLGTSCSAVETGQEAVVEKPLPSLSPCRMQCGVNSTCRRSSVGWVDTQTQIQAAASLPELRTPMSHYDIALVMSWITVLCVLASIHAQTQADTPEDTGQSS